MVDGDNAIDVDDDGNEMNNRRQWCLNSQQTICTAKVERANRAANSRFTNIYACTQQHNCENVCISVALPANCDNEWEFKKYFVVDVDNAFLLLPIPLACFNFHLSFVMVFYGC